MQKNKALKGLLAVSAAAAMLGAFGVQAQTAASTQGAADHSGHSGQSGGSTAGSTDMSGSTGSGATGMSSQSSGQSGTAGATAAGTAKMSKADSKGVTDMAMVNMAEIEMGKLAQSKSQNPEVKTYAQQMIDDHTKGLAEVQGVAQSKGVTLPTELDAKHKAVSSRLAKLSGEQFDREYMKVGGVASHKEAHAMLQKNQKGAKDPDVQALATKMMPVVEQHLKSAQQMPLAKGSTSSGK